MPGLRALYVAPHLGAGREARRSCVAVRGVRVGLAGAGAAERIDGEALRGVLSDPGAGEAQPYPRGATRGERAVSGRERAEYRGRDPRRSGRGTGKRSTDRASRPLRRSRFNEARPPARGRRKDSTMATMDGRPDGPQGIDPQSERGKLLMPGGLGALATAAALAGPDTVREAMDAIEKAAREPNADRPGAVVAVLRILVEADDWEHVPDARMQAALLAAADKPDAASMMAAVRAALDPPAAVADVFAAADPEPVLWRADGGAEGEALAGVGEVCILSGPGGAGKSSVALGLAHAAGEGEGDSGEACGLAVRRGPVLLASYEDSPGRLRGRFGWLGERDEWAHVSAALDPLPLWVGDPEGRRAAGLSTYWRPFWRLARSLDPSLVIVDPASVAFAGASPSDGAAVRAFLLALSREAGECGAAVLLVSHDAKAARYGGAPGAAAVSGSAQWIDGARAVLHLGPLAAPEAAGFPEGFTAGRLLRCIKSNYGRTGWGAALVERWEGSRYCGLRIERAIDRDGMDRIEREALGAARKPGKAQPPTGRNAHA